MAFSCLASSSHVSNEAVSIAYLSVRTEFVMYWFTYFTLPLFPFLVYYHHSEDILFFPHETSQC